MLRGDRGPRGGRKPVSRSRGGGRGGGSGRGGARNGYNRRRPGSKKNDGPKKPDPSDKSRKPLKLLFDGHEFALNNVHLKIGRAPTCEIVLKDDRVSSNHCKISDCVLVDAGSTNGTLLNGKEVTHNQWYQLQEEDVVVCGETELRIVAGSPPAQDFNQSKRFLGTALLEMKAAKEQEEKENSMTAKELMDEEFAKIIGHDKVKTQLRKFHKKVQLDEIRKKNGKLKDKKNLYHMIFMGPPGTGKTTMANLVARIMRKMKLVQTDKVIFVNNALELIAQYSGQTAPKVDAKVEEAKGGVLFIDEAYSIVKSGEQGKDSFGKEAIETIMKHLDPPSCVFIFAGYEKEMESFLEVNSGLSRRIPYRFTFDAYGEEDLTKIFMVMLESKGEALGGGLEPDKVEELVATMDADQRKTQNAGLINNWVSFAQIERDDRVDIEEAIKNPELASILCLEDLELALEKVMLAK